MLKSSFSPAGEPIAATMPSAMSSTWVSVRVCSPEPKICKRPLAGEHLADQVGHGVRDAGLVVGQLARAVGVEGPADREGQAVLVVRGAAVDLARELGEAVGGERHGAVGQIVLGRREQLGALEHHRGGHVHEALHLQLERRADDGVVERVVDLGERVGQPVEVGDPADDRGEVDHVGAALRGRARLGRARAGRRCAPRSPRASTGAPRARRTRAPRRPGRRAAAGRPRRRSCRRRL